MIVTIIGIIAMILIVISGIYIINRVDTVYDELPIKIRRKILKDQCRTQIYVQRYIHNYER